jgi:hypothetical protein
MKLLPLLSLAGLLAAASASRVPAGEYAYRQYYSGWTKHSQYNYYYRTYYYKPSADYVGYKHHYVIYHPHYPKHVYFYNPYRKVYWGRCPTQTNGKAQYSLLPEKARKGTIQDIPESAFPTPGAMPAIPDSTDGAKMDLPPDDLPKEELPPNEGAK